MFAFFSAGFATTLETQLFVSNIRLSNDFQVNADRSALGPGAPFRADFIFFNAECKLKNSTKNI